jgi:hypothetical protein
MVKRRKRTVKRRKRAKITPKKRAGRFNRASYWKTFRELKTKTDKAWKSFQSGVKKKADPATMMRRRNELLLLLGECNYMAKECARLDKQKKQRR